MHLGDGMAVIFIDYTEKLSELDGLNNEVIRQETSKQAPLTTIDETINSNELAFLSLKNYFAKEPGDNAYYGAIFLLGNQFNDHLTDADILATDDKASNQDIRSILWTNGNIDAWSDIPLLEQQYQEQVNLYAAIKNQRT